MHYYQRSSFSSLELHASWDQQVMAPNMCRGGFPICHYVHKCTQLENWRSYKDISPIKQLLYYRRYLSFWLELYVRYDQQVMDPNMHSNHFLIRHFVYTYTRNSKTTGCMQTLYISNDCSTIVDVFFMCYSWMWDTNAKLHLQACIAVSFW